MLYIPNDPLLAYRPRHLFRVTETARFSVTVNNEDCPTRLTRESKMPFNRVWPGMQRPFSQTEQGEYVLFYGDAPVRVTVTAAEGVNVSEAVLRPQRHGIKPEKNGNTVSFTLTENGYYSLECGSIHDSVQIFYCKPIEDDGGASANWSFGPGVHFADKMRLSSGERVYIHPEAVVFGSFLIEDAENITIYGGGVLDDSTEERVFEDCYNPESSGCIRAYRSKNLNIRDITCLNASNWVISTFDCDDVHIDGVKILGQWRYNTDGIDLVNASHCSITNCFIRSFDDTVVLKALYCHHAVEDITVENCVLWCGWGKTLEIGLETSADEYRDIHYKNIDCIHNSAGAMAVSNGNYAHVHDVTYENITVEYAAKEDAEHYQDADDTVYCGRYKTTHADLFKLSNWRMAEAYPYIDIAGDRAMQYGRTEHISYRNIAVFCEDAPEHIHAVFVSNDPAAPIRDIRIEHMTLNGQPMKDFSAICADIRGCEGMEIL